MSAAELSSGDLSADAEAARDNVSHDVLWPGARSERVSKVFTWWVERMFRKSFHAVRVAHGSMDQLRAMDGDPRPVIALISHSSWWDPLIGLVLGRRTTTRRKPIAPMQLDQLRKFKIMRKLGVFGLDPDQPSSLRVLVDHVFEEAQREPRTMLWITPQGEFADVRTAVRLRPGAAAVAARLKQVRVVSVACELGFWTDQRPEVFVRVAPVEGDGVTLSGWQRTMQSAMQANADELAKLVMARDPGAFEVIIGGDGVGAAVHPVYDLWLRVTGRSAKIDAVRRGGSGLGGGA